MMNRMIFIKIAILTLLLSCNSVIKSKAVNECDSNYIKINSAYNYLINKELIENVVVSEEYNDTKCSGFSRFLIKEYDKFYHSKYELVKRLREIDLHNKKNCSKSPKEILNENNQVGKDLLFISNVQDSLLTIEVFDYKDKEKISSNYYSGRTKIYLFTFKGNKVNSFFSDIIIYN